MNEKLDKKLVRKLAAEKLKSGKSKQEVYDELVEEFKYRNEIADIVVNIPTNARWKKYGVLNTVFLVFLILTTLALLIYPTFALLWMVFLIYLVAVKMFKQYYWFTVFGAIGITTMIALSVYQQSIAWIAMITIIPISVGFIIAGVFLPRLLTPAYTEVREPYINSEGENRIMVKHVFKE